MTRITARLPLGGRRSVAVFENPRPGAQAPLLQFRKASGEHAPSRMARASDVRAFAEALLDSIGESRLTVPVPRFVTATVEGSLGILDRETGRFAPGASRFELCNATPSRFEGFALDDLRRQAATGPGASTAESDLRTVGEWRVGDVVRATGGPHEGVVGTISEVVYSGRRPRYVKAPEFPFGVVVDRLELVRFAGDPVPAPAEPRFYVEQSEGVTVIRDRQRPTVEARFHLTGLATVQRVADRLESGVSSPHAWTWQTRERYVLAKLAGGFSAIVDREGGRRSLSCAPHLAAERLRAIRAGSVQFETLTTVSVSRPVEEIALPAEPTPAPEPRFYAAKSEGRPVVIDRERPEVEYGFLYVGSARDAAEDLNRGRGYYTHSPRERYVLAQAIVPALSETSLRWGVLDRLTGRFGSFGVPAGFREIAAGAVRESRVSAAGFRRLSTWEPQPGSVIEHRLDES